jgi:Domain of unknown function (DUF4349)
MDRLRRIGVVVGALALMAWAVGCGLTGDSSSRFSKVGGAGGSVHNAAVPERGAKAAIGAPGISSESSGPNFQELSALPQLNPKIIKTADVDVKLKHDQFQAGLQQAVQIAGRYQGFVLSTTVDSSGARKGVVVMRIPSSRFEAALADLKGLGKLTRENVSGQDVSQEYVDLKARLVNATAQEAVLLRLMNRAQSVGATIRVEQQLAQVQLQIERYKGQLRYLNNQTAMGTITLGLSEAGTVAHAQGPIGRAFEQARETFLGVIAAVIVGSAFILPVGVLVAMALLAMRRWRPRMGS